MHEFLINPLNVLLLFLLFVLAGLSLFILYKIMLIVLTLVNSEVTSNRNSHNLCQKVLLLLNGYGQLL